MRNIMLAATAIAGFGVLAAGAAQAQMPNQGVVTTSFGAPTLSGSFPEPGTVTVYLKTRFLTQFAYATDSQSVQAGVKTSGVQIQDYVRIYPGFDGKTNHGLEYGVALEIRQENASAGQSATNPAGGTQFSVNSTTGGGLFFRREGGYVGTAQLGRLWFGQTDGALGRLGVGAIGQYDTDGGWLGGPSYSINTNSRLDYAFPAASSVFYGQDRLVYVSPVFAGFDMSVSYEPNSTVGLNSCATQAIVNNCTDPASALSTSRTVVASQRRNTFEAALRYRGSFGPAAVAAQIGTMQSGTVTTNTFSLAGTELAGTATTFNAATASAGLIAPTAAKTKGLNVIDAGLSVSAYGATLMGHFLGGDINSDGSLIRHGQKKAQDFVFNPYYQFGRFVVGAQYMNELSAGFGATSTAAAGAITNGNSTLHQTGFGVGGTFDYAPGAQAWVSALYGTRHQDGFNISGAANYTATNYSVTSTTYTHAGNTTTARAIAIGNTFNF